MIQEEVQPKQNDQREDHRERNRTDETLTDKREVVGARP